MVYISFGSTILKKGDIAPDIPLNKINEAFQVDLEVPESDDLYTLVVYENGYVHLFGYNIHSGDVSTGVFPFPFDANQLMESVIYVDVYKQKDRLEYNTQGWDRQNFSVVDATRGSVLVDRLIFTIGDTYSGINTGISPSGKGQHDFFKTGTKLDEQEKKYCSCLLKVQDKGTAKSPYAVCTHSVGTTTRECSAEYDFDKIPTNLLQAYAKLHKLQVPEYTDRTGVLQAIHNKQSH